MQLPSLPQKKNTVLLQPAVTREWWVGKRVALGVAAITVYSFNHLEKSFHRSGSYPSFEVDFRMNALQFGLSFLATRY